MRRYEELADDLTKSKGKPHVERTAVALEIIAEVLVSHLWTLAREKQQKPPRG